MNRFLTAFARADRWVFVLFTLGAWLTRHGGDAWHQWLGYGVIVVVALRIAMGFVGPQDARFSHFLQSSGATIVYLKQLLQREAGGTSGHAPLERYTLAAILLAAVVTAISGWLHATDRFWGVTWIGAIHSVLAYALTAAIALYVVLILLSDPRKDHA